jgi:hypothetical protein
MWEPNVDPTSDEHCIDPRKESLSVQSVTPHSVPTSLVDSLSLSLSLSLHTHSLSLSLSLSLAIPCAHARSIGTLGALLLGGAAA